MSKNMPGNVPTSRQNIFSFCPKKTALEMLLLLPQTNTSGDVNVLSKIPKLEAQNTARNVPTSQK